MYLSCKLVCVPQVRSWTTCTSSRCPSGCCVFTRAWMSLLTTLLRWRNSGLSQWYRLPVVVWPVPVLTPSSFQLLRPLKNEVAVMLLLKSSVECCGDYNASWTNCIHCARACMCSVCHWSLDSPFLPLRTSLTTPNIHQWRFSGVGAGNSE